MLPNGPHFLTPMKKKPKSFYHLLERKIIGEQGFFSDGVVDGYVGFYNMEEPRPTPLNGETLAAFIASILSDATHAEAYRQGYVVGWSAALAESNPTFFFLEVAPDDKVYPVG